MNVEDLERAVLDAGGSDLEYRVRIPRRSLSRKSIVAWCYSAGRRVEVSAADHDRRGIERALAKLIRRLGHDPTDLASAPATRRTDPATSHTAECVLVNAGTMRAHILLILSSAARSARQLEGTHPYKRSPRTSWGKRLIDLERLGLVALAGTESSHGNGPASLYTITDQGRAALTALETNGKWTPPQPQETP